MCARAWAHAASRARLLPPFLCNALRYRAARLLMLGMFGRLLKGKTK